jgi:hypothetical protein
MPGRGAWSGCPMVVLALLFVCGRRFVVAFRRFAPGFRFVRAFAFFAIPTSVLARLSARDHTTPDL